MDLGKISGCRLDCSRCRLVVLSLLRGEVEVVEWRHVCNGHLEEQFWSCIQIPRGEEVGFDVEGKDENCC